MTKITELNEASSRDYLKNFSKRMLKTQLFIGSFQEKRYVEPLDAYRDVVRIDGEEKDFIENILAVKKKLKQELRPDILKQPAWIGITDPSIIGAPIGYSLWVELPIEVFGKYWFKVNTVEFLQNEVRLKLDVVRSLKNEKSYSDASEIQDNQELNAKQTFEDSFNKIKTNCTYFLTQHVTFGNIKESLIFISLLIGTIIAGGFNMLHYLMEYLLKFMRELSTLIKACSPVFISFINLIGKTIYGFYALIVALFSGRQNRQVYPYYNAVPNNTVMYGGTADTFANSRGLPYRRARILPMED